jgi:hypothetical protein
VLFTTCGIALAKKTILNMTVVGLLLVTITQSTVNAQSLIAETTISSFGVIAKDSNLSWLHTDGRWIKDSENRTVDFRGVGRQDLVLYYDDSNAPWGPLSIKRDIEIPSSYDLMKSIGVNLVRLQVSRGAIMENPDVLPLMDQIVVWCREREIRVEIELAQWERNWASNYSLVEWNEVVNPNPPIAWIDFFTLLAQRYINDSTVSMFSLYNEPSFYKAVSLSSSEIMAVWSDRVTQVAKAVHAVNPDLLISVDVPGFDLRKWETSDGSYWINEPNIVYAFHHYYNSELDWNRPQWALEYYNGNFSAAYPLYEQWIVQRYFWVAEQKNLPVWLSESGVFHDETKYPNSMKQMWDEYQILGNHSIGFAQWVWMSEWRPRDTGATFEQTIIAYTMLLNKQIILNEIGQQLANYLSSTTPP